MADETPHNIKVLFKSGASEVIEGRFGPYDAVYTMIGGHILPTNAIDRMIVLEVEDESLDAG